MTSAMGEVSIVTLGAPVLRERALEIEGIDDDLRQLVDRMFAIMYPAHGQGLAAPQIGLSLRLAVVDVPPGDDTYVLINPSVVWTSKLQVRSVEGCLSVPGVQEMVTRPAEVVVEAMNLAGETVRLEATGELARCFQHEIDHLNGMLYLDRLSPLARKMLLKRYRKLHARGEET